jgi:hypothetical protein
MHVLEVNFLAAANSRLVEMKPTGDLLAYNLNSRNLVCQTAKCNDVWVGNLLGYVASHVASVFTSLLSRHLLNPRREMFISARNVSLDGKFETVSRQVYIKKCYFFQSCKILVSTLSHTSHPIQHWAFVCQNPCFTRRVLIFK